MHFDCVQLAFCRIHTPHSQRVQLGMALSYPNKMKAEAPTPRQTLVHERVSGFTMLPHTVGLNALNDWRGAESQSL